MINQTSSCKGCSYLQHVLYKCRHGLFYQYGISTVLCVGLVVFSVLILSLVHPFRLSDGWGWYGVVHRRCIPQSLASCANRIFSNSFSWSCKIFLVIIYLHIKSLYRRSAAVLADLLVVTYTCTRLEE